MLQKLASLDHLDVKDLEIGQNAQGISLSALGTTIVLEPEEVDDVMLRLDRAKINFLRRSEVGDAVQKG